MITIKENAEVGHLTTFGVAARAARLVEFDHFRELPADLPSPLKMIGGGSNLLFAKPFEGTLLHRVGTNPIKEEDGGLLAEANVALDDLCAYAAERGLRGLENLSGVPGTLGGALVQNAGAYGVEIGELVESIELLEPVSLNHKRVSREWMGYSYRSSRLKNEPGHIILSAKLRLPAPDSAAKLDHGGLNRLITNPLASPMEVRQAVLDIRRAKLPDPKEVGSAGSFFRNPEVTAELLKPDMPRYDLGNGLYKVPAAWLIDQCGLKGKRMGGAMVWPSQPLVIVNADGQATAADIIALKDLIIAEVLSKFNIELTPEVEILC